MIFLSALQGLRIPSMVLHFHQHDWNGSQYTYCKSKCFQAYNKMQLHHFCALCRQRQVHWLYLSIKEEYHPCRPLCIWSVQWADQHYAQRYHCSHRSWTIRILGYPPMNLLDFKGRANRQDDCSFWSQPLDYRLK
jgi:hypothetical protein